MRILQRYDDDEPIVLVGFSMQVQSRTQLARVVPNRQMQPQSSERFREVSCLLDGRVIVGGKINLGVYCRQLGD